MEHKQQLELAQVLKLSPTLLQSMGILQMTTLELADYLQDLAMENPVMEETPGARETAWGRLCQPGALAGRGSGMASGGLGLVGNPAQRDREPESLAFFLVEQLDRQGLEQPLLAVCRYLVDLLDDHGSTGSGGSGGPDGPGCRRPCWRRGLPPCSPWTRRGWEPERWREPGLQLKRQPGDHRVALAICEKGLDLLAREQYGALARRLGVPRKQVEAAAQAIRGAGPQPCGGVGSPRGDRVPPPRCLGGGDRRDPADLCEPMGPASVPPQPGLPADGPEDPGGEAADYLRQKIQQARWVLQCVHGGRRP